MKSSKLAWIFVAFVAAVFAGPMVATAGTPTVNGLFYGDGDDGNYDLFSSDPGYGAIYKKQVGSILYVAVVLEGGANDNVFGEQKLDDAYLTAAGWNNHNFKHLVTSDHVQLRLTACGDSWEWYHGYLYDADGDSDPNEKDWLSGPGDNSIGGGTVPDGTGGTPELLATASSMQWNMNNTTWDVTLSSNRTSSTAYKSPDANGDDDVTDEAYPYYNEAYKWEWSMIYEFSIDLKTCGADEYNLEFLAAHNSPPKDRDPQFSQYDWGDAPDSYGTTDANSGPSHKILLGSGPVLGSLVDAEMDGQPTATADGDDINGSDDEDGLISISTLTPGSTGTIVVTGTAGAKLDAWLDFNSDGDFLDAGEQISTSTVLTGGNDSIDFPVPVGAVFGAGSALRLRVSTAGGLTPHGSAVDGEVEDYTLSASIGDYVWLDIDNDGIQDGTEGGFNNVTVELYDSSDTLVDSTVTAGGGAYLFTGLPPGDYYVKFYLPSTNHVFSPQNQGGDGEKDSDADPTTGKTTLTTLSVGENDLSWDAGVYVPSTLVALSSFGAALVDGNVVVQWSTSSEQDALGFYLERWDDNAGTYVRVNADLIPASIFSTGTVNYEAVDNDAVPGETYQYRLVELEITGKVNTYGPYTVSTEAPAGGDDDADVESSTVEAVEAAAPEVTGLTAGSGHMVLRWASAAGNTYRIERSDSANGEFEVIASGIPATAPENVLVLVDGADSGFYKIVSE